MNNKTGHTTTNAEWIFND